MTLEELFAPRDAAVEPGFVDEDPAPMFGSLDFDVALQEDLQSQLPQWLEGAESLAVLEPDPEDVPDELLSLATLDQGVDLSQQEVDRALLEARPVAAQSANVPGALLAIGGIALVLWLIGRGGRGGMFRGGKAGW